MTIKLVWLLACAVLLAAGPALSENAVSEVRTRSNWGQEAHIWRNVTGRTSGYDEDMAEIDALVDPGSLPENSHQIRALISRYDAANHYRSEANLQFLVKAIREGDYPGYPAIDVMTRAWEIDEGRRQKFIAWAKAFAGWASGESSYIKFGGRRSQTDELFGERTSGKEWLVASLAKTLRCFLDTPADRVAALNDETFIRAVYLDALGREPSPDDLGFRVKELSKGKERSAFMREVYNSEEVIRRRLRDIDDLAKSVR
jgi:hypothetical protein